MKTRSRRLFIAAATTALAFGGLTAASAAPTSHQIRESDVRTSGDGDASQEFLAEGIHLQTNDQSGYAAGTFDVHTDLKDVHSIDREWFGSGYGTANGNNDSTDGKSTGSVTIRYNVDFDDDGKWDCQLLGDLAYGGKDVWLNADTEDSPAATLPAGTCADNAPVTGGGSGSQYHGDLDDWATKLKAVKGDEPVVVSTGYLANGLIENGVLRSIMLGDDQYVFTDTPAAGTPSDVTGHQTHSFSGRYVSITLTSDATPAGHTEGTKIHWEIKIGKRGETLTTRYDATQGSDESALYKYRFNAGTKATIAVYKNGVLDEQFNFNSPK